MTASINSREGKLPENPSLENLKKQAKTVLKNFKKGDESVCGILQHLKKFKDQPPLKILKGEICLREAQHALALNYGFKSWKELQNMVESPEVPETADTVMDLIRYASKNNASDIHFEWSDGSLHVRFRIDGNFRNSEKEIPESEQIGIIERLKIMANLKTEVHDQPQQGMANVKIDGKSVYLRVSVIPYVTGESVVIRIWNDNSLLMSFEKLSFSETQEKTLRKWINMPNGIIIFSGPFGSGKTTSLYGAIQEMDATERKIVTAEDPVHLLLKGVNQLQIDPANGLTYARAIREQMNQDLDVIFVGECREKEVLDFIFNGALTGHLVLTQMHSNNAVDVLKQLLNMGADSYTLARTVIGVVSQRLVRKICNNCKEEYKPKEWEIESLGLDKNITLYKGKGCEKCHNTGYRGRIAVYEILEINDEIRSAIVKDASPYKLAEIAMKTGMTSLKKEGMTKALQGISSVDEILRVCG